MAVLNEKQREKYASYKDPEGKPHFPINDKTHAQLAIDFIDKAPPEERAHIRARAAQFGVKSRTFEERQKANESK